LHGKSTVQVDTGQSTLHPKFNPKFNLKRKPPLQPPTKDFIIKYNYTLQFIHCKKTKKNKKKRIVKHPQW